MALSSNFGKRVKTLRQRFNLSQAELARESGIDVKLLQVIEAGQKEDKLLTFELLACLANSLDVHPAELIV